MPHPKLSPSRTAHRPIQIKIIHRIRGIDIVVVDTAFDWVNLDESAEDGSVDSCSHVGEVGSEGEFGEFLVLAKIVGNKRAEYERTKSLISANPSLQKHYDLDEIQSELHEFENKLNLLTNRRHAVKESIFTYEKYLELFSDISVKLRETHDISMIDQILQKFFSNFTVKSVGRGKQQRCEITHKLNEPWNGFVINDDFDRGRG